MPSGNSYCYIHILFMYHALYFLTFIFTLASHVFFTFNRSQSKESVVNQMSQLFFRAQKYLLAVFNFLKMVIFTTLFRRWSALWNSMLKLCKFERWHTQRCFNIDLTLSSVATSYHPNKNVETTLKGILGIHQYC